MTGRRGLRIPELLACVRLSGDVGVMDMDAVSMSWAYEDPALKGLSARAIHEDLIAMVR